MEWDFSDAEIGDGAAKDAAGANRQARLDWVMKVARLLWGTGFRRPLAEAARVSVPSVEAWALGKRFPSAEAVGLVYQAVHQRRRLLDVALRAVPRVAALPALDPLPADEQAGDWTAVNLAPAAEPAPAPAAKALTEKQLARIERALEARGVRVLLGPPGDPTIRARAEADRAAGRVVYVADLSQHADLIGE